MRLTSRNSAEPAALKRKYSRTLAESFAFGWSPPPPVHVAKVKRCVALAQPSVPFVHLPSMPSFQLELVKMLT